MISADFILQFLTDYGPAALFVLVFMDSAMLLPVVPGELLLIVATHQFAKDRPSLIFLILVATAGQTVGNLPLYAISRYGGRHFIEAHPRLFLMSPTTRLKMETLFQRPAGQFLVAFFRLIPMVRILVSLPAGLARLPLLRFTILSAGGNLLFNAGIMGLTYEAQQPDSIIASRARDLRDAYAQPLWLFFREYGWIMLLVLAGVGLFATVVRSGQMQHRPAAGPRSSLVGSLATLVLFSGGIFILLGLWRNPDLIYGLTRTTGYDVELEMVDLPGAATLVMLLVAGLFFMLAFMLRAIRNRGQAAVDHYQSMATTPANGAAQREGRSLPRNPEP